MPHAVRVIVTGKAGLPPVDGHRGYVAGRYRDGLLSDTWTDVTRCARDTFVGYAPACTCGWIGDLQPSTPAGLRCCRQALIAEHISNLAPAQPPVLATVSPLRARSGSQPRVACVSATFKPASA